MSKIPTAKELSEKYTRLRSAVALKDLSDFAIEFAKLHVEAALQKAYENADLEYYGDEVCYNKDSILKAYPLTNIK